MAKIRVVKTGSGSSAVQAVRYYNNKRTILKHFGSANTELASQELLSCAQEWIKDYSGQLSIFQGDSS